MFDKQQLISWAKFLIGWPLSAISIIFIIKLITTQSSKLNIDFSNIKAPYLISGVILFFIYFLLRSFLWQQLLAQKNYKINFRENTYRFSISEIKRYTPGNIWSFLSRGNLFSELGVDKKTVGISLIADIQLVIIGCGVVSLLSLGWILSAPADLKLRLAGLLPFSAVLTIIYFVATAIIYQRRYQKDSSLLSSLVMPGFSFNSKLKIIIISVITYGVFGLANFFVFLSIFNLGFNYLLILSSFFTFALLVGYLSFITPTGLGIRELVVTLGLSSIMSASNAGAVSIFTRVVLVTAELTFLILIFLWEKSSSRK